MNGKNNMNLKYDRLREIVRASDITEDDDPTVSHAKRAPYRLQVLRTVVDDLKYARRQSAQVVCVLGPMAEGPELTAKRFHGVREVVPGAEEHVHIDTMRFSWCDAHPNTQDHQLFAEKPYFTLRSQSIRWTTRTDEALSTAIR
jgi:hypothetical protein